MQKALEALAEFRYLTIYQMIAADVSTNYSYLTRRMTKELLSPSLAAIGCHDFGVMPGVGKLARVFFLTDKGAELLAEATQGDPADIRYPVRGVQFSRDYFHRLAYVDICIAFSCYMRRNNYKIHGMRHYFDKIGKPRKGTALYPETRLALTRGYVVPDGLFYFETQGKRRVAAVEMHYSPRTSYIIDQLETHFVAIREGAASKFFGHDKANYVFSVFKDTAASERVRTLLMENEDFRKTFFPLFHFNTIDRLKADGFAAGWVMADGSPGGLVS